MDGKILGLDIENKSGVIKGSDNKRYNFSLSSWKHEKSPLINQSVDFVASGEEAKEIYPDGNYISSEKSKITAALLAFFLGGFGGHKFYLGCKNQGFIMMGISIIGMALAFIPNLFIGLIALAETIIYLTKSHDKFQETYVINKKCWF